MRELAAVVNNASRLADYVVVSIHAHDQGPYLQTFARAMIDAGADMFVGTWPPFPDRHRTLPRQAYHVLPGRLHLPERDAPRACPMRTTLARTSPAILRLVADFNANRYDNETQGFPVRHRSGNRWWRCPPSGEMNSCRSSCTPDSLSGFGNFLRCGVVRCSPTASWAARSSTTSSKPRRGMARLWSGSRTAASALSGFRVRPHPGAKHPLQGPCAIRLPISTGADRTARIRRMRPMHSQALARFWEAGSRGPGAAGRPAPRVPPRTTFGRLRPPR